MKETRKYVQLALKLMVCKLFANDGFSISEFLNVVGKP